MHRLTPFIEGARTLPSPVLLVPYPGLISSTYACSYTTHASNASRDWLPNELAYPLTPTASSGLASLGRLTPLASVGLSLTCLDLTLQPPPQLKELDRGKKIGLRRRQLSQRLCFRMRCIAYPGKGHRKRHETSKLRIGRSIPRIGQPPLHWKREQGNVTRGRQMSVVTANRVGRWVFFTPMSEDVIPSSGMGKDPIASIDMFPGSVAKSEMQF